MRILYVIILFTLFSCNKINYENKIEEFNLFETTIKDRQTKFLTQDTSLLVNDIHDYITRLRGIYTVEDIHYRVSNIMRIVEFHDYDFIKVKIIYKLDLYHNIVSKSTVKNETFLIRYRPEGRYWEIFPFKQVGPFVEF